MNTTSKSGTKTEEPIPGLRDFMASASLSILGNSKTIATPDGIAKYCYEVADAMLKEREKHIAK